MKMQNLIHHMTEYSRNILLGYVYVRWGSLISYNHAHTNILSADSCTLNRVYMCTLNCLTITQIASQNKSR